jgi:hypothetical protein
MKTWIDLEVKSRADHVELRGPGVALEMSANEARQLAIDLIVRADFADEYCKFPLKPERYKALQLLCGAQRSH